MGTRMKAFAGGATAGVERRVEQVVQVPDVDHFEVDPHIGSAARPARRGRLKACGLAICRRSLRSVRSTT
jgi:hypothetical protein